MHKIYETKYVNTISLICSIIVFTLICLINKQIRSISFSSISNLGNDKIVSVQFNNSIEDNTKENIMNKKETTEKQTDDGNSLSDSTSKLKYVSFKENGSCYLKKHRNTYGY